MKYCNYDIEGNLQGFYDDEIHNSIPIFSIQISEKEWLDYLNNQDSRKIDITTKQIIKVDIPNPTPVTTPNWNSLTAALRGTPLFGKIYYSSKSRLEINVAFTLMSATLNSSNPNVEDLQFALTDAKNMMGDLLSVEDIARLNQILTENGFNFQI